MRTTPPSQRRFARRGFVFATSLILLLVMFITGIVFLSIASNELSEAQHGMQAVHALADADAGVNYMIWNQKYSTESNAKIADTDILPATTNLTTLQDGTASRAQLVMPTAEQSTGEMYAVWLMKYTLPTSPSGQLDGYQIISHGTYRDYQRSLRVIVRAPSQVSTGNPPTNPLPPPVLDYALFSGSGLSIGGNGTIYGDIGANLDIAITSGAASVVGNAKAGGRITQKKSGSISGTKSEHQAQVVLSDIIQMANLLAYAQHYGTVYTGNKTFAGTSTMTNKLFYAKGDVTINANTTFAGIVTIVSEGNITVNGNTSNTGSSTTSNLILVSPNAVTMKVNGNADIFATIIAPGVNANFSGNGNANIIGAVVANSVNATGNINITYKKPNTDLVVIPPPPSYYTDDTYSWTMASWQQVN